MIYLKTFEEAVGKTIQSIIHDVYGDTVINFTDDTALPLEGGASIGGDGYIIVKSMES